MERAPIGQSQLYELIVKYKTELEKNRDEINKYYTSLFTVLLSFIPFVDKIAGFIDMQSKSYNLRYALILLSILGSLLSISWQLTLQRIHIYLQGIDALLIKMENDCNINFIKHMTEYLNKIDAPARVTKHQIIVPYAFMAIFSGVFIYSAIWLFF